MASTLQAPDESLPQTTALGTRRLAGKSLSAVFAFGATNLFSYGFLFVAGRYLAKPSFGLLNSLVGVLAIVGLLAGSVQVALTRTVALNRDIGLAGLRVFLGRTARYGSWTLLLSLPAMPILARVLGASYVALLVTGITSVSLVLGAGASGFLAGRALVPTQAWAGFAGAAARLIFGWAAFFAGMGAVAGVSCYLLNQLVIVAIAALALRASDKTTNNHAESVHAPIDWVSSLSYLFALVPLFLDQILTQALGRQLAGDYAALATVAKLVYFASYPVVMVVYPHLLSFREDRATWRTLVGISILVTVAVTGLIAVPLAVEPQLAIRLLLGDRYVSVSALAARFSLSMVAFSVSALLLHIMIARGERRLLVPGVIIAALQATLFGLRHQSLPQLVDNQVVVNLASLLMFGSWAIRGLRRGSSPHRPASDEQDQSRPNSGAAEPGQLGSPEAIGTDRPRLGVSVLMGTRSLQACDERIWEPIFGAERVRQIVVVVDGPATEAERALADGLRARAPHLSWSVRYLGRPQGLAAALNAGIDDITQPLVARQDDDDLSHPGRFDLQAVEFEADDQLQVLGSSLAYERDGLKKVRKYPSSEEEILSMLPYSNPFAHPTVMIRAATLKRFRYRSRFYTEDYDLFLRAFGGGGLRNLAEPVVTYRIKAPAELARFDHARALRAHAALKWSYRRTLLRRAPSIRFYVLLVLELAFSLAPKGFYRWFYTRKLYP